MSAHNSFGLTVYGPMMSVEATCDDNHDGEYVIFPHENSKAVDCVECDETIFIGRDNPTAREIVADENAVGEALG